MKKLEYYVLNYDFNKKELYNFNIFNSCRFSESIEEDAAKYFNNELTRNEFKERVKTDLMYSFWSKREYELFIGDAFEEDLDKYEKVDVYSQVLPNLDILVDYIIKNYTVENN